VDLNSPESRGEGAGLPDVLLSPKDSWNKRSIYKLLKYRTKNSHSKYKLQTIIEVIKWHFMFYPPVSHQKFKKALWAS
jgi:hypothetical protein